MVLFGLVALAMRRSWAALLFLVGGIAIPLGLIPLFQIARSAMARYIIYILPLYLLAAAIGVTTLLLFSRAAADWVGRIDTRRLSAGTMLLLLALVTGFTGPGGLAVMLVATGIGLIPVLWGSRRPNCMGVLLLPLTLNMIGVGTIIAGWLGLV